MRYKCRRCGLPSPRQYHPVCFEEMYQEEQILTAHTKKQKEERRKSLKTKVAKARAAVNHTSRGERYASKGRYATEQKWAEAFAKSKNPEAQFEDVGVRRTKALIS